MLDTRIRSVIDPYLNRVGVALAKRGISANAVTITGFIIGVIAAGFIAAGMFWLALILIMISRLCDGLDGAIARVSKPTDFGGYLDIVLDFAFYGLIPVAFIYLDPTRNGVAGSVLLLTFYVNGASFLTFALMAEKRGLDDNTRGSKSLLYTTGLAEASETIALFVLFCLFPAWFNPLAWIFAALVTWTTISRFAMARDVFGED